MFREAIILAGGFGTRLSHVVSDVPKPMAPVYGRPFLCYLLDRLNDAGVEHVVLATGYKHEVIASYFGERYRDLRLSYSQETEPLFTGGAICQAAKLLTGDDFIVLNGDTLFDIDLAQLYQFHTFCRSHLTVALRQVEDTSRYGAVQLRGDEIVAFQEKTNSAGPGLINGGIYAINRAWLMDFPLPEKFSFEKELMQPLAGTPLFYGLAFSSYFIDIGIPEDYFRAQEEFPFHFPPSTFLFLDRDGVLNTHLLGDYVRSWDMWEWLPGVLETMPLLAQRFQRIFLVSNQQGVGKGLMSQADLEDIHRRMVADIEAAGGRIDAIYTCTDLAESNSPNRKPAIGMALQAQKDFPEVEFHRSVMVGDNITDMLFARNAQMRAVFVSPDAAYPQLLPSDVRSITDLSIVSLSALAI